MSTPHIETARTLQARFAPAVLIRNRWVLAAIAVLALVAVVAASWSWLVATGLATLLVSALPCLVMCGFGRCMYRFLGGSSSPQASESTYAEPQIGAARAAND